jgi:hypothetical protein
MDDKVEIEEEIIMRRVPKTGIAEGDADALAVQGTNLRLRDGNIASAYTRKHERVSKIIVI